MEVGDRISDPTGKTTRDIPNHRQLVVRLFVLSDRIDQHCYTLEYKNIDKIELNYSGKIKLFPMGMFSNLGDWGYDELTSIANGLFRHESCFLRERPSSSILGKFPSIEPLPNKDAKP
jgi:hypothetical protein